MKNIQVSKKFSFTGHNDCVYTLKSAEKPSQFLSASGDGMVVLWDIQLPDKGEVVAKVPTSVYALDYCNHQDLLVIGQNYDGIHLMSLNQKKQLGSLKLTTAAIFDIKILDRKIFIGTGDGELIIVDRHSITISHRIKISQKSLRCIAIDPLNRLLITGFSDNMIRVFDLDSFSLIKEIEAHQNSIFTLSFSKDYKYLLSSGRDAHLKVWDAGNEFTLKETIVAHMYAINHIEFSPDFQYFATCSMDKSIKIWDAKEFKLLKVIDKARHAGHGTSVNKLMWSSFNNNLVSCSDDRSISIWDVSLMDNKP